MIPQGLDLSPARPAIGPLELQTASATASRDGWSPTVPSWGGTANRTRPMSQPVRIKLLAHMLTVRLPQHTCRLATSPVVTAKFAARPGSV